ncbi:LOW QUALITY PROTEIN: olfactory receptor 1G1-like [Sus scrofa]|uniref:LOW QUALITY PROTEIN: olfactory receptor 1G1-like n=1 Tax=Sus scrofa TaxID=9823 RepID=UPI000A2B5AC3|nr:LOW QUALITY PROTEIN: olfactory receptor 1G1-like [Sus scrofa]
MGKLHSPYRSRASSGLQQRTQPMAFPIYRAKPVALFGQGIQCTVLPHSGHKQQDVQILGPIWLTCQGREANSYPHLWIMLYLLGLLGNLLLLLTIGADIRPHTPMYFFLIWLSDNLLLTAMAIDCYAAICHPLHYPLLMTPGGCGLLTNKQFKIPYLSCDFGPLFQLSCSDAHLNENLMLVLAGLLGISPLLCTISSYVHILHAVAKAPSAQGKKKALATCSSHLSVVILFYSTVFATYLKPPSTSHSSGELVAAVMYTLVTPTLNPFIYSLRNKDVKSSLKRVWGIESSLD